MKVVSPHSTSMQKSMIQCTFWCRHQRRLPLIVNLCFKNGETRTNDLTSHLGKKVIQSSRDSHTPSVKQCHLKAIGTAVAQTMAVTLLRTSASLLCVPIENWSSI